MTTAPDLPIPPQPGTALGYAATADPAQPYARPALALVPTAQVPDQASSDDIVDFDDALARAIPRLRRYAARRLLDQHEAEEVVQEAMLRAFQHRATLATEDDLMAWLTVVTGRLVIDRLRVRGRTTPVAELPPTARAGRDTADVVVARDEARIALDALEAMPSRQASVLWAREVEGMSYDEIGDRFGLSEPTVRSLLHRARRTLRREYAERGGTLPSLGLVALAPWLHGLKVAGRLRDIVRRGGSAAAVAATGLAVTTVAPLWSHPAPTHTVAAPPVHAYVARVQPNHLVVHPAAHRVKIHPTAAAAKASDSDGFTGPAPIKTLPHTPCGASTRVNCTAHTGNTLYLILPTGSDVGVASNDAACSTIPDTVVTHCEPTPGKTS
jgi:RNA polymerase sigma-70 factor (ECF subfamily)